MWPAGIKCSFPPSCLSEENKGSALAHIAQCSLRSTSNLDIMLFVYCQLCVWGHWVAVPAKTNKQTKHTKKTQSCWLEVVFKEKTIRSAVWVVLRQAKISNPIYRHWVMALLNKILFILSVASNQNPLLTSLWNKASNAEVAARVPCGSRTPCCSQSW